MKGLAILIGSATLLMFSGYLFAAKSTAKWFNETTIESPFTLVHPVTSAELLPNPGKEILTIGVDDKGQRWLAIYALDQVSGQYSMTVREAIPAQYLRYDLSEYQVGSLQQIYFMSANSLAVFNHQTKQFNPLAKIDSIFLQDQPQFISRAKFVYRWSEQGDNILISGFSDLTLLSVLDNKVTSSQKLAIKPRVNLSANSASFNEKKFYLADINFDQRQDLVLVGDGELIVYQQQEQQMFAQQPISITINSSISGVEWWSKRDETGNQLDQTDLVYRKLEQLKDLNNDGITDMVVRLTKSSGVLDRSNDYEIFLGRKKSQLLSFATTENSVIRADGTLTGLQFVDIDNDKKLEVLLAGFDIGISQIIGALLSGSIDQDVFMFKMDAQDNFGGKPNVSKEVELNFSISSGQTGSPVVKLADINGDGLKDLVLSNGDEQLRIYFGNNSKRMFAKRGKKYKTQLPQDGGEMTVVDLNGDGKDDLLVKYGKLDDQELQRTFKVYFSTAQ